MNILQQVANRKENCVRIELDDLVQFSDDPQFVASIEGNAHRYVRLFAAAIDDVLPPPNIALAADARHSRFAHRANAKQSAAAGEARPPAPGAPPTPDRSLNPLPPALTRNFCVRIIPLTKRAAVPLRRLRAAHLGRLISVRGIVTRVSELKPLVSVVTYVCSMCSFEIYQEVTSREFQPQTKCPTSNCAARGAVLHMQTRSSKFDSLQELRLQEMTEEVPIGHIPRSVMVQLRGELVRTCSPGDLVSLAGIFLPTPYAGFRGIKAALIADTYIDATHVTQHKKSYADCALQMTDLLRAELVAFASEGAQYERLARSIAPEIWGHLDVKKALLLQMVAGSRKEMLDGMVIRGDLNICLMGDPGVAKSQLLKHMAQIAPRAVYTSGKGSSGVGLTAAVLKDPLTNDLVLEGGALVLADMGICCIDEFDKMEDADRTAIHEVMEQQTISIAKAGITTRLNARTSILAAANPAFGRYNVARSPSANIDLPAALLSRFDLLFLLLDRPDRERDRQLAEHVTHVHRVGSHPPDQFLQTDQLCSASLMRAYISLARQKEPSVPRPLTNFIVNAYVNMRQSEQKADDDFTYTTARSLLAILRLSQALARLRLADEINEADIGEAIRLMTASKESLAAHKRDAVQHVQDAVSAIFSILREAVNEMPDQGGVDYDQVLQRVLNRGFSEPQLKECLHEYESLNVLMRVDHRICFIS